MAGLGLGKGSSCRWPLRGPCLSAPQWGGGKGRDVCGGMAGGSHGWGGPTSRRVGAGLSGQLFQAYTEATFSCVGTRVGGVQGGQRSRAPPPKQKKGVLAEGAETAP